MQDTPLSDEVSRNPEKVAKAMFCPILSVHTSWPVLSVRQYTESEMATITNDPYTSTFIIVPNPIS
jgi:hypothetical protein